MSLKQQIMEQLKTAMKNKDKIALESLRSIKSELLLLETGRGTTDISQDQELKILQKLVKQRKDSALTYQQQNRDDLAEHELAQAEIIASFLPQQLSEKEIEEAVKKIIEKIGATSMADMGRVMGVASKELAGKAEGKTIAAMVKTYLGTKQGF